MNKPKTVQLPYYRNIATNLIENNVEIEAKLINLMYMYMSTYFPGLVQYLN